MQSTRTIAAADPRHLTVAQRERLARFAVEECVDIHCHCLPCIDDGPATMPEALALCQALVDDGITTVVATPHQLGRYEGRNEGPAIREAVAALNRTLMVEGISLRVLSGADVRIDVNIGRLIGEGRVLTIGDAGSAILLELPHDTFINPLSLLRQLADSGVRPVISHPERHRHLTSHPDVIEPWLACGAILQLTAGSIIGDFGATAQRAAWYWLETGRALLVATDAHDAERRPPRLSAAIHEISRRLGENVAARVCLKNPARLIEGRDLLRAPDVAMPWT